MCRILVGIKTKMDSELDESLKMVLIHKLKKINQLYNPPSSQKSHQTPPRTAKRDVRKTPPNEEVSKNNSPLKEQGFSTRHLLKLLELERQEEVQTNLNARLNVFKEFDKIQQEKSKQARAIAQRVVTDGMDLQARQIIEADDHYNAQQSTTLSEMTHLREVALKQMQDRQNVLFAANKKLISEQIVKRISVNILKYYEEMKKMLSLANSLSKSGKPMSTFVPINNSVLEMLNTTVQVLVRKCNSEHLNLTEQDIATSESLLSKAIDIHNDYKGKVADFNIKQAQIESDQSLQQNKSDEITDQKTTLAQTSPTEIQTNTKAVPVSSVRSDEAIPEARKLSKYINVKDLQRYESLLSFSERFKQSFAQLENDSSLKTFRFDCKKAINVPVNSLSDVNAQHILDKYKKLHDLLCGQTVQIANKQQINAGRHPQGVAFCMDLLARKFVLQGDTMVSSNPESAFPYASVILSLWNDFPDFGQLLLAYFFQLCPYLVPYYVPKQLGESEEDFYKKLGYQYNSDGEVEKQDKFLKRMTGIMRLYFALTITKPKSSQASSPYDLRNSWRWLSSFLKLEPQLDITATALHVFLETVGFQMKAVYGRVFDKVMQIIVKVFLPKCYKAQCTGGAVTRLELLVTEYLQKNSFEVPSGYNEKPFW